MPEMMRAVRKEKPEPGFVVRDVPRPEPGPEDVLVYVEAASVCGTDLHIWHWDDWSARRIRPPLTLGHEFCGTIVGVGSKVKQAAVGEYVSAGASPTKLSINAFLFLMGLGGLIALLSPPSSLANASKRFGR